MLVFFASKDGPVHPPTRAIHNGPPLPALDLSWPNKQPQVGPDVEINKWA